MVDSTRLDGKVAIVTGAAQGIGRGIANVLSEAGATIVIGDLQDADTTVEEIRSKGGQVVVQDEESSVVWGMPGAVANGGFAQKILPLGMIPGEVLIRIKRGARG